MTRVYHQCHFCGGEVTEQRVTVDYRWGDKLLTIIENVPAGVCQVCGERYFKAEIVKQMEQIALSKQHPAKVVEVPVRRLQVA
jgi:YgiT-type zinc finger domain-containing protein